jgi:acyl carrier protein
MEDRSHANTFEKVRQIIADHSGVKAETITLDTDLVQDLGITGDDGKQILIALDKTFKIDWTGFDAGLVFGNEGCGLPPPWALKDNPELYESQACSVGDLVQAAETGKWPIAHKAIPLQQSKKTGVYILSVIHLLLILIIAIPIVIGIAMAIF